MNGVWRMVLQRLGGTVSTDLPETTLLFIRNEVFRFEEDGVMRAKISLTRSGNNQRFLISGPDGNQAGLVRFLENGRMEFAVNFDPQQPLVSLDDAQVLWRLERVNSPETKFEKQAFEIIESAKVATAQLECFVANKKPDVSEQTFQALKNAVEIRELKYDGEVMWLLGEKVLSTEDILAAEVVDQPGSNFGLLVQVTEAAGERMRIATTSNVNKLMAIVVDGKLLSAPRIVEPISGPRFALSGDFTRETATELAEQIVPELKLPAGIKISSVGCAAGRWRICESSPWRFTITLTSTIGFQTKKICRSVRTIHPTVGESRSCPTSRDNSRSTISIISTSHGTARKTGWCSRRCPQCFAIHRLPVIQ